MTQESSRGRTGLLFALCGLLSIVIGMFALRRMLHRTPAADSGAGFRAGATRPMAGGSTRIP